MEKAALMAKANRKKGELEDRARKLLEKLPQIVQGYRAQIQNALKVLASPDVVETARNATRRLLQGGRITLAPNAQRNGVCGPVNLKDLGMHLLELAGVRRVLRGPDVSPVVAGA